jgi:hypothetical protein
MHNSAAMTGKPKAAKRRFPTPEEEAELGLYPRGKDSDLQFPVLNFIRSLYAASKGLRIGKRSVAPYIGGCLMPAAEFASFGVKKYGIDVRRVVVQHQGILRTRPCLEKWKLTFPILADDESMEDGVLEAIEPIAHEAGKRIGIGDGRPEKGLCYGRFKVTGFKLSSV